MPTPTVSGTFISNPEGGMEYGVDYGAPGLLHAPVFSPLSGTVVGYSTQQGWNPGRLLISTSQGLLGIGHIVSGLVPGQIITAGQQVGTIGDSSAYGGTPESTAHVEVMLSPSGINTYRGFTGGGAATVAQDTSLAAYALGGQTAPGSGPAIVTTSTASGGSGANSNCLGLGDVLASNAHGSSIPIVGGLIGGISGTALAPVSLVEWAIQPCKRWSFAAYVGAAVVVGLGIYLVFRKQANEAISSIGKAAAA